MKKIQLPHRNFTTKKMLKTVQNEMKKQGIGKIELWDAEHPLRKMAIRIIEEVIEPVLGRGLQGEKYYKIEDDLVALLSNLELKQ